MDTNTDILFCGIKYEINLAQQAFIQCSNPENKIDFSHLKEADGFYKIEYNNLHRRAKDDLLPGQDFERQVGLIVQKELLLPNFVAENDYSELHNQLSYKYGWHTLLFDDAIRRRLEGKLPELIIGEEKWILDVERDQIRSVNRPDVVTTDIVEILASGICLYDQKRNTVLGKDEDLIKYKDDLVLLSLPKLVTLDPIGFARRINAAEETVILSMHPQLASREIKEAFPFTQLQTRVTNKLIAEREKFLRTKPKRVTRRGKGLR